MRTFFKFLFDGDSHRVLITVVALGALSGLLGAALIAVISQVFTRSAVLDPHELTYYALLLCALVLVSLLVDFLARQHLLKYSAARHRDLHITFSRIVLNDSLRHTEQIGIARLITIYAEDMSLIGGALNQLANVGVSIFVVAGCLIYLATVSLSILAITLLVGALAALGYRLIHRESIRLARNAFEYRDRHVSQFKDLVHGIGELKLNYRKRREYIDEEYLPSVHAHERQYVKSMLVHLFANGWVQMVFFALMIAILFFIVLTGMDPQVLGPFLVVALFMRSHVAGLIGAIPSWSRAGVTLERMRDQGYTNLQQARTLNRADPLPGAVDGNIQISVDKLVWRYTSEVDDSVFTVGPLSVSMQSGEIVFLTGHNGAGKTTFAKLLCGLYANEAGTLSCNAVLIDDDNRSSYNEIFSMIFSDPFIFDRLTLPSDEAIGNDLSYAGRIAQYLERLQLHHKVRVDDQRLSTTRLSSGQRKRLALLAAYLEDKPVMIFDEWAENQDPLFKQVFYNELLQELKARGKLVVVISHEAQFYGVADRVITLDASRAGATQLIDAG